MWALDQGVQGHFGHEWGAFCDLDRLMGSTHLCTYPEICLVPGLAPTSAKLSSATKFSTLKGVGEGRRKYNRARVVVVCAR